ncbi:OLC1v1022761C1 [Oldenlandia corymbosa var. corymbosa]|uniref:OLC1v1022761C1 n=1 Tax=Oldenlandia corymbosa var. corymbosa TaxID=529605 RepID=A0AAV1C170_OLDCO|nr:OLC1v1022761C1 [Oldenlandia corymbosa var. corymbosa]
MIGELVSSGLTSPTEAEINKLSRKRKLALAPAVLPTLYKNLSLLRAKITSSSDSVVIAAGQFHLVLLWAFEHFPDALAPDSPNILKPGERVSRRHNLSSRNLTVSQVKMAVIQSENFEWRPYAADYENWRHVSYYGGKEEQIETKDMESYFHFLQPCELSGLDLDCKEKYQPQRVARQFGLDQELPAANSSCAHEIFLPIFVPPKSFLGGVSQRYYKWLKESMSPPESGTLIKALPSEKENQQRKIDMMEIRRRMLKEIAQVVAIDEPEAKRKAAGSYTEAPIIIDEMHGESGKRISPNVTVDEPTQIEDAGKSIKNPILIC